MREVVKWGTVAAYQGVLSFPGREAIIHLVNPSAPFHSLYRPFSFPFPFTAAIGDRYPSGDSPN